MTYLLPIDQYQAVKSQMTDQEHTVLWENHEYYDFNMNSPKYKDNPKLRQALSMAVDREALVKSVMGQGQKASYAYATSTVEGGKFAGLDYEWASWPRDRQIAEAQRLFKEPATALIIHYKLTSATIRRTTKRKLHWLSPPCGNRCLALPASR